MTIYEQLVRDEGKRAVLYYDSRGIPSIGIGHNLFVPISDAAIEQIFTDDLARVEAQLAATLPWATGLSEPRRGVLLNMIFNIGLRGFLDHNPKFIAALHAGDWDLAAREMMDGPWHRQVGIRADRLKMQLLQDAWQ